MNERTSYLSGTMNDETRAYRQNIYTYRTAARPMVFTFVSSKAPCLMIFGPKTTKEKPPAPSPPVPPIAPSSRLGVRDRVSIDAFEVQAALSVGIVAFSMAMLASGRGEPGTYLPVLTGTVAFWFPSPTRT